MNAPQPFSASVRLLASGKIGEPLLPLLEDAAAAPPSTDPIAVSLASLSETLLAREGPVTLRLGADDDPLTLRGRLEGVAAIEVRFDKLADGRGYTHAFRLRRELGWTGPLHAVGDVGVDQLHYLLRVGFDGFVLRAGTSVDDAKAALVRFDHHYEGVRVRSRA